MHGKAVAVSISVPNWFATQLGPMSSHTYSTTPSDLGNHEVIIVGKNDTLNGGSYIIANSWGTDWGDNGYGTIPYNYQSYSMRMTDIKVVNGFQGIDVTWTTERKNTAMVYSSVLDRAAEHSGMEYWVNALKNGTSLQQVTNFIMNSAEANTLYGNASHSSFLDTLYQNTLGRAIDASSLQFWLSELNNGVSRGDVAYKLMMSTLNTTGTGSAPTLAEHDFLVNRTTVSTNFGLTYQIEGGAENINIGREALDAVNSNADSVQIALVGIQKDMGWL